jgi:hypothetical protein
MEPQKRKRTRKIKQKYVCVVAEHTQNRARIIRSSHPDLVLYVANDDPHAKTIENVCQSYFEDWASLQIVYGSETSKLIMGSQDNIEFPLNITFATKASSDRTNNLFLKRLQHECEHEPFVPLEQQIDLIKNWYCKQGKEILHGDRRDAFLIDWSMGSGKSQASLFIFSLFFVPKVMILCQNTMIETWVRFVSVMPPFERSTTSFEIYGLTEFSKMILIDSHFVKDQYVIFDEGHQFRNRTDAMKLQIAALREAKCKLILTGTPVMNASADIIGLGESMNWNFDPRDIALLESSDTSSLARHKIAAVVEKVFRDRVHYYNPQEFEENSIHYKPITKTCKYVTMSWQQTIDYLVYKKQSFSIGDYLIASSRRNSYHVKQKLCSNADMHGGWSPKFEAIVRDTLAFPGGKGQIIYSNFLSSGINQIYEKLKASGKVKVELVTGDTDNLVRDAAFDRYNKGEIDVLCLSSVCALGLSFRGTKILRLVDAFENLQMEFQCLARTSRYHSHDKDDKEDLIALKYISTFPTSFTSEEAKETATYFYVHYCNPKWGNQQSIIGTDSQFMRDILLKIENEEKNQTIDQQLERTNAVKQDVHCLPILVQLAALGKEPCAKQQPFTLRLD